MIMSINGDPGPELLCNITPGPSRLVTAQMVATVDMRLHGGELAYMQQLWADAQQPHVPYGTEDPWCK